jgi:hypothetical protein
MTGTAWLPGHLSFRSDFQPYLWDVWAIGEGPASNDHCPLPTNYGTLPNMYGMFLPIDNSDSESTSGFGLWRLYVFQSGGF